MVELARAAGFDGCRADLGRSRRPEPLGRRVEAGFPERRRRSGARATRWSGSEELEGVYGVVVARGGELVVEEYFREGRRDKPHNLKSASKSVMSALIGIAVDEGAIDLDAPIDRYLVEARQLDEQKRGITVRDLLTMSSGLEPTSYESYSQWVEESDWVAATLATPLVAEPGSLYQYSTANTHLLSAILTAATGMSSRDFAESRLFDPLGVQIRGWERDPKGIYIGGNNLSLLPLDMVRFGQLFLDGGRWGDRQVVSLEWVEESTGTGSRGLHRTYGTYGYLWFTDLVFEDAFMAVGYGGQYIYVSPAHDAVVVVTSTLESKGAVWTDELFRQLRGGVLAGLGPSRRFFELVGRPWGDPALAALEAALRESEAQLSELKRRSIDPSSPAEERARTTTQVNLRERPEQGSRRIELLGPGQRVLVLGHRAEWAEVEVRGRRGWVHGDYLEIEDPSWRPVAARLRRELEAFSETVSPLVGQVAAGSAPTASPADLRSASPSNAAAEAEIAALKARSAELERRLRSSENRLVEASALASSGVSLAEQERMASDLEAIAAEVAELRTRVEERDRELAQSNRELAGRSQDLEASRSENATLLREVESLRASLEESDDRRAEAGAERATRDSQRLADLESRLAERQNALAAAEARVESVETQLEREREERRQAQARVADLTKRTASLEEAAGETTSLLERIAQLEASLEAGELRAGRLEQERDGFERSLAEMTSLRAENASLQSERANLLSELRALQASLAAADSTASGLEMQVDELESALAAAREGAGQEQSELASLLAEERGRVARLSSELRTEAESNAASRADLEIRSEEVSVLEARLEEVGSVLAARGRELGELRSLLEVERRRTAELAQAAQRDRAEGLERLAETERRSSARREADRSRIDELEASLAETKRLAEGARVQSDEKVADLEAAVVLEERRSLQAAERADAASTRIAELETELETARAALALDRTRRTDGAPRPRD